MELNIFIKAVLYLQYLIIMTSQTLQKLQKFGVYVLFSAFAKDSYCIHYKTNGSMHHQIEDNQPLVNLVL